jgi:hypothetical protein
MPDVMVGVKNKEALKDVQRFLLQEGVAANTVPLKYKYDKAKETPPSQWFDDINDAGRKNFIKEADKNGVEGSDEKKIKEGMKTLKLPIKNAAIAKTFTDAGFKAEYSYEPVEIKSLRKGGGTLILTQQEVLDISKLLRMDAMTSGKLLTKPPTKLELAQAVNTYIDDVVTASGNPRGATDISDVYKAKKTALIQKLERKTKEKEKELSETPGEMIDFDRYKVPVLDKDKKPVLDKDGKPRMQLSSDKILLLTMAEGKANDDTKVVTLPKSALEELEEERLAAEGLMSVATNTPLPRREESNMLKDKDTGKGEETGRA